MARTAVVAGVGPGLGESLARRFADEGCDVGLFARSEPYLTELAADLRGGGVDATAAPTDVSDPEEVRRGFERVRDELGPVDVLVNHASGGAWKGVRDVSAEEFRDALLVGPYGGFLCAQHAVPDMVERGEGTIIFTGATSAVRGRAGAAAFSAAKFAVRGLAESMAAELGPAGIHVAHVVIDGQIATPGARESSPDRDPDTFLDPDDIATTYWRLVEQDASTMDFEVHVTNGRQGIEFV